MKFFTDEHVAARYSVCSSTIHRWASTNPDFPKPVALSPGCTRWRLEDLEAFEAKLTAPAPLPPEVKAKRGRPRKAIWAEQIVAQAKIDLAESARKKAAQPEGGAA